MSVIIQEMVDAKISGVMFTANPLNNSRKEVYIEAIAGLGEALVQGAINGDRYVVSKDNLFITQKEAIEEEPYLTDFNIKWLVNEGLKLQYLFYDDPQDIEWAFDKGEIYLLQSRPITTLGEDEPEDWWRS
jgi:pyruvate,water dikinase